MKDFLINIFDGLFGYLIHQLNIHPDYWVFVLILFICAIYWVAASTIGIAMLLIGYNMGRANAAPEYKAEKMKNSFLEKENHSLHEENRALRSKIKHIGHLSTLVGKKE